jgi:hypothetical protein
LALAFFYRKLYERPPWGFYKETDR